MIPSCPLSPPEQTLLLAVAKQLGEEIWAQRFPTKDGSPTWPQPPQDGQPPASGEKRRVGPFLYDGLAGIALFYAALATLEEDGDRQRERCLATLAPLRALLAGVLADPARSSRLALEPGGAIGIGSLIYAFSMIGRLIGEPTLLSEARSLMALLSPERIAGDDRLDLLSGTAGALLALLGLAALEEPSASSSPPLALAGLCGRHLLARQNRDGPSGSRTWQTLPTFPPLAGVNHGTAGICHALLELYRRNGEEPLLTAAVEGFAFESRFFSATHGSWRDLRFSEEERYGLNWCSGAAGIAAVRASCCDLTDTTLLREELEAGLRALGSAPLLAIDYACCGNAGIVEGLLIAGLRLDREDLTQAAGTRLIAVVERAAVEGSFRYRLPPRGGAFDPAFYTGAAGLGYTMLRMLRPRLLPAVLLLAPPPVDPQA